MVQHHDALAAATNRGLLDLVAYAGFTALSAAQVFVAVDDGTAVTVRGSTEPDLDGCLVYGAAGIPVGTITNVRLDRLPDGSLQLWQEPGHRHDPCGQSATGAMPARVLRSRDVDGVGLVILADWAQRAPRADADQFMRTLLTAAQDAVAAQRDQLEQRLRGRLQEREDERRRWARELHDETLQQMGALQVLLTSTLRGAGTRTESRDTVLDALAQASSMLAGQITSLRHLITELRPATLDELGLSAPLHALARRTEELTGLCVEVQVSLRYSDGLLATRLLPDIEVAVYRVVQEALTNASRHAEATRARVFVLETDTEVRVEVSDDGKGIHRISAAPGFGITGMQERAALAGGRLEVLPATPRAGAAGGRGTLIRLVVPATHRVPEDTMLAAAAGDEQQGAEQPHS